MNNLGMLLEYFSEEPEALARKLSANQCDECCVGCKAHCKKTNHGDKGCKDTILEWLQEEAPGICQNIYMTRIEQSVLEERSRWADVFDKIRADIDILKKQEIYKSEVSRDARISTNHLDRAVTYKDCLDIIDKYIEGAKNNEHNT